MENSQTEPVAHNPSKNASLFALWLSWRELSGRKIVFGINVIIIGLLIALPVTLDLMNRVRQSTIDSKIDYLGPSLSLVPKGILSSDLVKAELRGLTYSSIVYESIARNFAPLLRGVEARLISRITINGESIPVVGIDFNEVYSYPFARYSLKRNEILMGELAAKKLDKQKGDILHLGQSAFTVVDITETAGGIDDMSVFLPLFVLQDMTGQKGRISETRIFPRSESALEGLKAELSDFRAVIDMVDSYRGEVAEKEIDTTLQFYHKAIYTAIFMLIALCILISTYINLDSRKAEISTVYTLGTRKGIIFSVLMFRTIWISVLGSLGGHFLALIITLIQDHQLHIQHIWRWDSFAAIVLGTTGLGILVTTPFSVHAVYRRNLIEHL
jgi:ABC-type lipoprotein release transport system permease subunit